MRRRLLSTAALAVACASPEKPAPESAPTDTGEPAEAHDSGVAEDPGEDCTPVPWYPDADGDGYGARVAPVEACEAPADHVDRDGDCDDSRADVHPEAPEVCDAESRDEDCDGRADDADDSTDPATMGTWYTDADGDGHAGPSTFTACDPGAEAATAATDCDDTDAAVHPEAEELCGDGIDNDCSGREDNGCLPDSLDDAVAWIAGDGDGFGVGIDGGDLTGDGIDDLVVGTYIAGSIYEGAALVFQGPVSGALTAADAVGTVWGTTLEGALGYQVSVVEDIDGDGADDLFLGAMGLGGSIAKTPGYGYLVTASPVGGLALPADAVAVFEGAQVGANAGAYVDAVGDLDGDGHTDFVVGAASAHELGGNTGQTYLFHGPVSGSYPLGSAYDTVLYGDDWAGGMADWLSWGDLTGDGLSELIVPANSSHAAGIVSGAVFVFSDPPSGAVALEHGADARVDGTASLGLGVATAVGDFTGDGYLDLVASDGTLPGSVYVFAGPLSGTSDVTGAHVRYDGAGAAFMDRTGWALDRTDLDHDGVDDLAIGCPHIETAMAGAGAVHLFLGPLSSGTASVTAAESTIVGTAPDALGIAVVAVGDVTGSGLEDLAITSTYRNEGAGQVWIFE